MGQNVPSLNFSFIRIKPDGDIPTYDTVGINPFCFLLVTCRGSQPFKVGDSEKVQRQTAPL